MGLLIFYIGCILGSFYLVIATRLPNNEDIIFTRSHCDNCEVTLKWYQLIPIFSYLLFLGKCPKCKKRIPILNLLVEIVTGLLFLFMFNRYGISYEFFAGIIISSLMIIIFVTDFNYLIILDSPLIISAILLLILKFIYFGFISMLYSLGFGVLMFLIMLLVSILGKRLFKKEALGGGDIKLATIIGIVLGFRLGLCALILSSFLALPISLTALLATKNNEVPFGPFLVGSLFVIFIYIEKFTNLLNLLFSF
jgi:prepilin signal peptidase PulO-like enzyme (type II secretory pathway)